MAFSEKNPSLHTLRFCGIVSVSAVPPVISLGMGLERKPVVLHITGPLCYPQARRLASPICVWRMRAKMYRTGPNVTQLQAK